MGGVARGGTANLFGAVVAAACTFLVTIVVTHAISRAAAGTFFSTTSIFLLLTTLGLLGTDTGLVYFLSRARGTGTPGLSSAYVRTALVPVVAVGIGAGITLLVVAAPLSRLINPHHASASTHYLQVLAIFVPFVGIEGVFLAAFRGMGSMRANVVVEQLGRPALQLVLVGLLLSLAGQRILALAWAFGYLPAAVVSAWWWRRIRPRPPTTQGEVARPEHLTRTFWRFSGPRAIASVAQLTIQRFDIVLVGAMAGAVAAAVYAATTRFLVVGQMGNRAISLAVQPRLGEALGRHDLAATRHFYEISTAWLMLVTWPLYLMFVVFGQRLLTVFGRGYDAGNDVLLVLAVTMLFATACGMVDMVLNMAGRTSWNLYNVLLSLVVQFGLDILLIPHLGILGAAIGWAAAIAIGNLAALLQVGLSLGLHPFGRATALAALLGVACFLVVPTAIRFAMGDTWAAVAVSALVGGLVYALLLWRLRRPLELTALREIRRRKATSTG